MSETASILQKDASIPESSQPDTARAAVLEFQNRQLLDQFRGGNDTGYQP